MRGQSAHPRISGQTPAILTAPAYPFPKAMRCLAVLSAEGKDADPDQADRPLRNSKRTTLTVGLQLHSKHTLERATSVRLSAPLFCRLHRRYALASFKLARHERPVPREESGSLKTYSTLY